MVATPVDEIPGIVSSLRRAYNDGVTRPLEWRRQQLEALRRLVEENEDEIAEALRKDLRRCKHEAIIFEMIDVLGQVQYMQDNLAKFTKTSYLSAPLSQKPVSFEVWKEPLGVVTLIAPWNFPLAVMLNPLAGAIAAGNACVLKPSEISAAAAELLATLIPKYMDNSAIRIVSGGIPETTALLAEKVDHIMFTGSAQVGRIIMAAAAKHLTPVTLELGGKCPVYVDKSANLDTTARRIVAAKSTNTGQACVAPDYVLVHEEVRDAFIEKVKVEHNRLYPGDQQKNPDLGRIISDRQFERLADLLKDHGGKVVMGGQIAAAERFMSLTVVMDPSRDSNLMKGEIFGPILPVLTVKSVEEAIDVVRSSSTPLAAYVFERDPEVRSTWLTKVESGGACVNDCVLQVLCNEISGLGGKGESGMGRTRGKASFDTFTHSKTVAIQYPNFDPLVKYPPYKEGSLDFVKTLLLGKIPTWVKVSFCGAVAAVGATVAAYVAKHVDVSVTFK